MPIQYVLTSKLTMCKSDADPGFKHRNQAITLLCSTIGANYWYILHMDMDNFSLLNPHQYPP